MGPDCVGADARLPGFEADEEGRSRPHACAHPDLTVLVSLRCRRPRSGTSCGPTTPSGAPARSSWRASGCGPRRILTRAPGYGRCSIACRRACVRAELAGARDVPVADRPRASSSRCTRRCANRAPSCATSYFDGVYWEMDGIDRPAAYFAAKYGQPAARRRHAGGLPLPRRAAHGHRPRERRSDRFDRAGGCPHDYDVEMSAGRELPRQRDRPQLAAACRARSPIGRRG